MNEREAARWLNYARVDLDAGYTLLRDPDHYPRQICYLAQQAAEKAIKAIFVWLEIKHPFSHDLDRLRDLLPEGWQVKKQYPDLAELTVWAIVTRYPADMPDIVEADARHALELAEEIYQLIEAEIVEKSKNEK